MTAEEIIDLLGSSFDVSVVPEATMLVFLNERYRRAVAESLWRSAEVSIGPTVAGQSRYALPADTVDVRLVFSGSYSAPSIYNPAAQTGVLQVRDPTRSVFISGEGAGVFSEGADSSGGAFIDLEPAPDTAGLALVGLTPILPVALTNGAVSPITPADTHMGLYWGTKADLHVFVNEREDLAGLCEARFDAMVAKLAFRKRSRVGSGPMRVGVSVGGR